MLLLPLLLWPISPLGHPFPQRWWERGGQTVRAFSPTCALGRGAGARGQMRGLQAYLSMVDECCENNVKTIQLDPV